MMNRITEDLGDRTVYRVTTTLDNPPALIDALREFAPPDQWRARGENIWATPEALKAAEQGHPRTVQEDDRRRREAEPVTLAELSQEYGILHNTLLQACIAGRLEARKSGGTWLAARAALDRAIAKGRVRRPKR
jgi:hypothetical protein